MNPTTALQIPSDLVPLPFVVMSLALVVLPSICFGVARRWSQTQPQLAGSILAGAISVALVGILCATFIALVVLGWVPPLSVLIGRG